MKNERFLLNPPWFYPCVWHCRCKQINASIFPHVQKDFTQTGFCNWGCEIWGNADLTSPGLISKLLFCKSGSLACRECGKHCWVFRGVLLWSIKTIQIQVRDNVQSADQYSNINQFIKLKINKWAWPYLCISSALGWKVLIPMSKIISLQSILRHKMAPVAL